MKQHSDSTVSDFLNSVTDDQSIGFLNSWNETVFCKTFLHKKFMEGVLQVVEISTDIGTVAFFGMVSKTAVYSDHTEPPAR